MTITKNHTISDEEIIDQILINGNTTLFEHIYDRYANKVFRKCISFTKEKSIAEDLTHDIFIQVYSKLSNFQKKSKFSTWLYIITYNYCVDYVRKKKRTKEVEHLDQVQYDNLGDYDDFELEIREANAAKLNRALDLISPDEKMLLLMKYQDNVSIKELSEHMNLTESAIKMRLKRSKDKVIEIYNSKTI